MNLSNEDKAVLIAAAKILIRKPDEFMFDYHDEECSVSYSYEEVARELCVLAELPGVYKLLPLKMLLERK